MSDFETKMHQILFPLGPCPRLRWGSLPQGTIVVFGTTSKGRDEGEAWKGEERKGKRNGKREGKSIGERERRRSKERGRWP